MQINTKRKLWLRLFVIKLLLFAILITSSANLVIADTYYVSTPGNDGNDGSISSPWRTINYALYHTGAGDTVLVRSGTYGPGGDGIWVRFDHGHGGTAGALWTLKAYPGEEVNINSRIILEASYIRFKGFNIVNGRGIEIWTRDYGPVRQRTTNVEVIENKIIGIGYRYGAITARGDNLLIEGNYIEVTQSNTLDHGIYLHAGSNNVVRNNHIKKAYGYGIHVYDEDKGVGYDHHYSSILIENNIVDHTDTRAAIVIGNGLEITVDGIVIRNNVLANIGTNNGIQIQNYGGLYIRNVEIYNNSIYGNSYGLSISQGSGGTISDIIFMNNILTSSQISHIYKNGIVDNLLIDHNLYWQPESVGNGVEDNYPIYDNPLFVSEIDRDFHLLQGSPAIDAGIDVGISYMGNAPDLGAFEYASEPLSVKLISFEASVKGNSVQLTWKTVSEVNNLGFEVERKLDNVQFKRIGFVNGHGSTTISQTYQFLDEGLEVGHYYYRLKQINTDGTFEYSSLKEALVDLPHKFNLQQNYPNPFNSETKISFCLSVDSFIDLSLFNTLGQRIATLMRGKQTAGWKTVKWRGVDDVGLKITSGIYLYRLAVKDHSIVKRMVLLQ